MASPHLDKLRAEGHVEEPAVLAIEEVEIEANHAAKAVGGLFVGNHTPEATMPIAVALRVPGCIAQNTVGESAQEANLLAFWRRKVRANDQHPPKGALNLT